MDKKIRSILISAVIITIIFLGIIYGSRIPADSTTGPSGPHIPIPSGYTLFNNNVSIGKSLGSNLSFNLTHKNATKILIYTSTSSVHNSTMNIYFPNGTLESRSPAGGTSLTSIFPSHSKYLTTGTWHMNLTAKHKMTFYIKITAQ